MGSVVKEFFFDTDLEGWVLNGTGITYSTEYGYPTIGCLKAYASGKNQTYTGGATWAGSYNDLGIPIGATVTGIDFRVTEEIPVCNNSGISWGFKYNAGTDLINTQNESVVRVLSYRTIVPITGLSIPSANSVDLAFLCTVTTGTNVSNTITAWFDGIMMTITYTEAVSIPEGSSQATIIITVQGSGHLIALTSIQGSSEIQLFIVSEAAGIKLARAPPSEVNVSILVEGSFIVIKTGSSQTSVAVSQDGYSEKIGIDGSQTSIGTNVEGLGTAIRQGSSQTSIAVTSEGSGQLLLGNGSVVNVVVTSEGSGSTLRQGSSQTSIITSVIGSGSIIRQGNSEVIIAVTSEGYGQPVLGNSSTANVIVVAEGSESAIKLGESESQISVATNGFCVAVKIDGSESRVLVSPQGNGKKVIEVYLGGSEVLLNVSTEASGLKKTQSASESTIRIDTISTWKTYREGSSDTSITVVSVGSGHNIQMPGIPVEIFLMPVDEVFKVVNDDEFFILPMETYIFIKFKEEYVFIVPKEDVFYAV